MNGETMAFRHTDYLGFHGTCVRIDVDLHAFSHLSVAAPASCLVQKAGISQGTDSPELQIGPIVGFDGNFLRREPWLTQGDDS